MFKKRFFFLMIVPVMLSWQIIFGLAALILAWVLVKQTRLIFKINAWVRDTIFSDQVVLFSGKRVAILLLVLGVISIFSGVENMSRHQGLKPRIKAKIFSQAQSDYLSQNYDKTIQRCADLLRFDPTNLPARELMASAMFAKGEKEKAKEMVAMILAADPKYPLSRGPLAKLYSKKN